MINFEELFTTENFSKSIVIKENLSKIFNSLQSQFILHCLIKNKQQAELFCNNKMLKGEDLKMNLLLLKNIEFILVINALFVIKEFIVVPKI